MESRPLRELEPIRRGGLPWLRIGLVPVRSNIRHDTGTTQCISVGIGPNQQYYFGLRYTGESICSTSYYSDTACTNVVSGSTGITLQGNAGPTNWTAALSGADVTPAGTHSLMVNCGPVVGAGSVDLIYVNTSTYSF